MVKLSYTLATAHSRKISMAAAMLLSVLNERGELFIEEVRQYYSEVTDKDYSYSATCGMLRSLSNRGLVNIVREGRYMVYSITPSGRDVFKVRFKALASRKVKTPKAKIMYLVRGVSGAGKSTHAAKLKREIELAGGRAEIFEADQFFLNKLGTYVFEPERLKEAHADCQRRVNYAIEDGIVPIVANTFTSLWEMNAYLDFKVKYGLEVVVKTMEGKYASIHDVPVEVIARQKERMVGHDAAVVYVENYSPNGKQMTA